VIEFTQFLFPDGRKKVVSIELDIPIEDKFYDLTESGFRFEIENNRGEIWATCIRQDHEHVDVLGKNGEHVPVLIQKLICNSWEKYIWKEM